MRIYIDEAGSFVVPQKPKHSFSLVLALIVPSAAESELFYEFLRLRDGWPVRAIEIKGSTLDESQSAAVIDLLARYDPLVEFVAVDMLAHPDNLVDRFRKGQADAVTAHLTPQHNAGITKQLHALAETILKMPNQLFLQAFLTMRLILETLQESTLYYVQRKPKELGDIGWIVDRKDRTVTEMERTWTTLILPMGERHFATTPLGTLEGADYSHFEARYGITESNIDSEMARHIDWMSSTYGTPMRMSPDKFGLDAKLLLTDERSFADSRDYLGLQLADICATILRRALNGRLQFRGWKNFGKLLVRRRNSGSFFVQLGPGKGHIYLPKYAAQVCRVLDSRAKSMLLRK